MDSGMHTSQFMDINEVSSNMQISIVESEVNKNSKNATSETAISMLTSKIKQDLHQGSILMKNLRKENKELFASLTSIKKNKLLNDEAIKRNDIAAVRKHLAASTKSYNKMKYSNTVLQEKLQKKLEEVDTLTIESKPLLHNKHPKALYLKVLENKLDKVLINQKEGLLIQNTYNNLLDKLLLERTEFDLQLSALEGAIQHKNKDLNDLCCLAQDAKKTKEEIYSQILKFKEDFNINLMEKNAVITKYRTYIMNKIDQFKSSEGASDKDLSIDEPEVIDEPNTGNMLLEDTLMKSIFDSTLSEDIHIYNSLLQSTESKNVHDLLVQFDNDKINFELVRDEINKLTTSIDILKSKRDSIIEQKDKRLYAHIGQNAVDQSHNLYQGTNIYYLLKQQNDQFKIDLETKIHTYNDSRYIYNELIEGLQSLVKKVYVFSSNVAVNQIKIYYSKLLSSSDVVYDADMLKYTEQLHNTNPSDLIQFLQQSVKLIQKEVIQLKGQVIKEDISDLELDYLLEEEVKQVNMDIPKVNVRVSFDKNNSDIIIINHDKEVGKSKATGINSQDNIACDVIEEDPHDRATLKAISNSVVERENKQVKK